MSTPLDEIRKYIGAEGEPVVYSIDTGAIKFYADALMDSDPLYYDEEYAKTTKHGGIIAPPTFYGGATSLRNLKAGDQRTMTSAHFPVPPGWVSVNAGDEFELFAPVRPGDTLTSREKLVEAHEKQGHSGYLIFTTKEKTITNQQGQVVLIRRTTNSYRQPSSEGKPVERSHRVQEEREGTALPGLTKGPLTIRQLAMFAAATAEFSDIHYDKDFAQSRGLPDPIVQGLFKTATIAQMLKDWTGDGTAIKRLATQNRGIDVVGNTLTAGGRVTGVSEEENGKRVECEVWVSNQDGQRTVTGTATLVVPVK